MAVVKTWEINTCERDLADGYITKVIYRVKATEDDVEIFNTRETGEVNFDKPESLPSDFVAYDKLDETTVIGWVKTKLDADEAGRVAAIEKVIDDNIALISTPVTATGKPF